MTCHVPRCDKPALTLNYPACFDHARQYADRRIAAAEEFRQWVLAHKPEEAT